MPGWTGLGSLQETRFTPWRDYAEAAFRQDQAPTKGGASCSAFIIDTGSTKERLPGFFRGLSALPLHVASFVASFVAASLTT